MNPAPTAYAFPSRALQRWAREQLTLTPQPDGGLTAEFRFEGSTCGNVPFVWRYVLRLDAAQRIHAMSCGPGSGDENHRRMCAFLGTGNTWVNQVGSEAPCVGDSLQQAVAWRAASSPAGCLCTAASRNHKWQAVIQTVHYALNRPETGAPPSPAMRASLAPNPTGVDSNQPVSATALQSDGASTSQPSL